LQLIVLIVFLYVIHANCHYTRQTNVNIHDNSAMTNDEGAYRRDSAPPGR